MTPSLEQRRAHAVEEFHQATLELLKTEDGIHAETAVAAAARMAGTFLFRSFGFDVKGIPPGTPALSDKANDHGPLLVDVLGATLERIGVRLDGHRIQRPLNDEGHQPLLTFLDSQQKLEPRYAIIRHRWGLSLEDAAAAAATTAALLIRDTAHVLDPHIAFGIAAFGFVEGAKTVPAPMV